MVVMHLLPIYPSGFSPILKINAPSERQNIEKRKITREFEN